MSMYADYLKEKTEDLVVETKEGFATYRYMSYHGEPAVYIVDIYIVPQFRQKNAASSLADEIVTYGTRNGCKYLLGSVIPSNKNSTISLKVLLGYGMILDSCSTDFILFKKDI